MTRYFFNIKRSEGLCADNEGQEFSSVTDARFAAITSLCEIAGDSLRAVSKVDVEAIQITKSDGRVVGVITMLEAVAPLLPHV